MNTHKWLAVLGLTFIAILCIAIITPEIQAQPNKVNTSDSNETKKVDKNSAEKFGVGESLASSDDDDDDPTGKPTKFQMGLGLGSIPVAYMAWKWL